MNGFKIEVLQFVNYRRAAEGMNEFIEDCNKSGVEILDIVSHVIDKAERTIYVFVLKLKE